MREVLYEETAIASNYAKQKKWYMLFLVLSRIFYGLAFVFLLCMFYIDLISSLFFMVWCILTGLFFTYCKKRFYNAFDYIFVSGSVRIIKVRNSKSRKKVLLFESNEVTHIGLYESEQYENLKKQPDVKVLFAPENKYYDEKDKYYLAVEHEGKKYLLVLECSKKFLSYILSFSKNVQVEKDL